MNEVATHDETNEESDAKRGAGFWISMAVLIGFGLFIAIGFAGAYFLMQPAS